MGAAAAAEMTIVTLPVVRFLCVLGGYERICSKLGKRYKINPNGAQ